MIFVKSIKTGVFLVELKIAIVIPVFKTGEESHLNNYRPISILPTFSIISEIIMYNRLSSNKTQFVIQQTIWILVNLLH